MSSQRLVVVDTTGIQNYIFGSNRLRENIGASYLVKQATIAWADEAAGADARIYAGGGNYVALFADTAAETTFVKKLSQRVLEEAPGLQLVFAGQDFEEGAYLADVLKAAMKELVRLKGCRELSAPLLGLSVTQVCQSTGLPAIDEATVKNQNPYSVSAETYPVSAETKAKLDVFDAANKDLAEAFPPKPGLVYPYDLDHLGGTHGDMNYLAVVHADGNGMGKRLQAIADSYGKDNPDPVDDVNREYRKQLEEFSQALNDAAIAAIRKTLATLDRNIREEQEHGKTVYKLVHGEQGEREIRLTERFLPFRPVVFGGDDVTFLCEGRLGVSLAVEYLRHFETCAENALKDKASACAGIAIVKTHYPFSRAYALSESLCKKAKDYRRQIDRQIDYTGSCLDWHFALSGLTGDIDTIREREYMVRLRDSAAEGGGEKVSWGRLHLRPVTLDANPQRSQRAWPEIETRITRLQGPIWSEKRNKVKALRDVLREGKQAVERFKKIYQETDALLLQDDGWYIDFNLEQEKFSTLFDAIELADFYFPLTGAATKEQTTC